MKNPLLRKPYWAALGICVAAMLSGFVATESYANDQAMIDPDADKVLSEMSAYMSGLSGFAADFDVSTDIITSDGQKVKFAASGDLIVSRPGKFRIKRLGTLAEIEFVLNGETLTLYGKRINGYLELPAASIDEAIAKIRDDIGFEVPGADILSPDPLNLNATDVVSGVHVGMTTVGGDPVHHLAFRGNQVDWQIWIKDGEEPLPVKYVITSKLMAGAPEYALQITNWNITPQLDDAAFAFVPPSAAQNLTSMTIDAAGNVIGSSE